MYTVSQLAQLAGVSPRTLRYYDTIGLLRPSRNGSQAVRQYDEAAVLRLQQILFYRELDLPLAEIQKILEHRDFDLRAALLGHRQALLQRQARLGRLLATVNNTLSHLKGEQIMPTQALFSAFTDQEAEAMAQQAAQEYDPAVVAESHRLWQSYTAKQKQAILEEGNQIYSNLCQHVTADPASGPVQALVAQWQHHMEYFWKPERSQLLGLAEIYVNDPRFRANFDRLDPRLAEFMLKAVTVYIKP